MRGRRAREIAHLLPFLGVVLFMPPYVTLFDRDAQVAGIPLLPLALFGLWFVGLLLTAWNARSLTRLPDEAAAEVEESPPADDGAVPRDGPLNDR